MLPPQELTFHIYHFAGYPLPHISDYSVFSALSEHHFVLGIQSGR